ncbi:hypothetical protein BpHYR1_046243, partial [Brachionus plicatilis]
VVFEREKPNCVEQQTQMVAMASLLLTTICLASEKYLLHVTTPDSGLEPDAFVWPICIIAYHPSLQRRPSTNLHAKSIDQQNSFK